MRYRSRDVPFYLTWAAVTLLPCSITAMNIALGLGVLALAIARWRDPGSVRFPALKAPLAALFVWTLLSILSSGHIAQGWEGVRKFYLFLMLLLVVSTVRTRARIRALAWGLTASTALSAAWSLVQFAHKYRAARAAGLDFRLTYTAGERITGFMSHWMTLSGEEMIVLLVIGALLLFGAKQRGRGLLIAAGALIAVSLAAGYTRSMWMGTALGAAYLMWYRDKRWLLALPAVALLIVAVNPAGLGSRLISSWHPAGDVDSNRFRVICRHTALAMMRAHPWFGVGPGQVRPQFMSYIPADEPRPLPPGAYIHMHNTYLQFAAERGIPALAALLWMLGRMLFDLLLAARSRPRDWVLRAAVAVMIAVVAAGWYEHNLGNGEVLPLFLAVVGCGYSAAALDAGAAEADEG